MVTCRLRALPVCVCGRAHRSPWLFVSMERLPKGQILHPASNELILLEFSKNEKCILHYSYKYDTITITVKEKVYYCGGIQ